MSGPIYSCRNRTAWPAVQFRNLIIPIVRFINSSFVFPAVEWMNGEGS